MFHEMTVFGFTIDSIASRPVVILKDTRGNNPIPIWISTTDALAIAAELVLGGNSSGGKAKDLMSLFLEKTGTEIGAIIIGGLNNGLDIAHVKFLRGDEEFLVEVRPCEAIMAALKYKMQILVSEEVMERASVNAMSGEELGGENNARRFAEFLENLDPTTLGKYPM